MLKDQFDWGQLWATLFDGPTEHALLNHPSARADFLPTHRAVLGSGKFPMGDAALPMIPPSPGFFTSVRIPNQLMDTK